MQDISALLTRDGHQVLRNAQRIAKAHQRPVIDSEVLLLAVLQLSGSQAEQVLKTLRIKIENLIARLTASIKMDAQQAEPLLDKGTRIDKVDVSSDGLMVLTQARLEAEQQAVDFIDTRLLILGMLGCPQSNAGRFLEQYGVDLEQFRTTAKLQDAPLSNISRLKRPAISLDGIYFGISTIFMGLVAFTVFTAYLTWAGIGNSQAMMFFFVIGGWVISVALHEFGHAIVAYWGGDDSVVDKGYLTLNPLKYTHPFLSVFMPVLFLIMGGIGLPGGAVYIDPLALRTPGIRSLTSAAGPIMSALCTLLLLIPFFFEWYSYEIIFAHFEFWAGLGLLTFLQITAICINMLPIPGLDGFGILHPYLSPDMAAKADLVRPFGFIILFGLLLMDTPLRDVFWEEIWNLVVQINPGVAYLANEGLQMFRLW